MSLKQNDSWLEDASQNFQQALIEGNVELGEAILQDMRDRGYGAAANSLLKVVNDEANV